MPVDEVRLATIDPEMTEPITTDVAPSAPSRRDADVASSDPGAPEGSEKSRRPDWFHRGHPVFFPLAGFFTGMLSVIIVPGAYGAILQWLFGYERAEELFPFILLLLVVPIGLLVPQHTRRFARYMLIGMLSTVVVVALVGFGVAWFLINRDLH